MLNSRYLHSINSPCQDKLIRAFELCQGLKELDLIWVILKNLKAEKKEKKRKN